MAKVKGKCPSLITASHGKPQFETAKAKRTCKRCREKIEKNQKCASIPKPNSMGRQTFCLKCLKKIIEQSRKDLAKIEKACIT